MQPLLNFLVMFLGLGLGITVFVLGLIWLMGNLGGWGALARSYAVTPETFKGIMLEEKRQRKAWVGAVRYGTLVTARSYDHGVELVTAFPFSPPLFFPWSEIGNYKRASLFPWTVDQFTVAGVQIRLTNPLDELGRRLGELRVSQ